MNGKPNKRDRTDDRLPLRWAVILLATIASGIGVAAISGGVAGWGAALATLAVLHKVLGT